MSNLCSPDLKNILRVTLKDFQDWGIKEVTNLRFFAGQTC